MRRKAILAYLTEHGQPFRTDASNEDRRLTRNRLRHELLPELARNYNPAIVELLCGMAEQASEVQEDVTRAAAKLLADAELPAPRA